MIHNGSHMDSTLCSTLIQHGKLLAKQRLQSRIQLEVNKKDCNLVNIIFYVENFRFGRAFVGAPFCMLLIRIGRGGSCGRSG